MKILLISQSSTNGMNYQLAKDIMERLVIFSDSLECKYINSSDIQSNEISEFSHIIMIVPEWNSSFPFTFKKMIDDSGYPSTFENKEILLIGTSDTTFGNIMGITHLQHILEWCNANVYKKRICVPELRKLSFDREEQKERFDKTLKEFLNEK